MKVKVSKIAFFYFLLLTFIFSNQDFSMSYSRVKQKNLFPLIIPAPDVLSIPDCQAMLGRDRRHPDRRHDIAWIADFLKKLRRAWAKTGRPLLQARLMLTDYARSCMIKDPNSPKIARIHVDSRRRKTATDSRPTRPRRARAGRGAR
jgi:hypothetical protein